MARPPKTDATPKQPRAPRAATPTPAPLLSSPERAEIWSAVMQRVQNEKEQLVLHACFTLRMKPGEVIEAFPEVFQNAQELYRTKQNLLERLRRDQALRKYLAPYA